MDLAFWPAPDSLAGHAQAPLFSLESSLGSNQLTKSSDYHVTVIVLRTWQETRQV